MTFAIRIVRMSVHRSSTLEAGVFAKVGVVLPSSLCGYTLMSRRKIRIKQTCNPPIQDSRYKKSHLPIKTKTLQRSSYYLPPWCTFCGISVVQRDPCLCSTWKTTFKHGSLPQNCPLYTTLPWLYIALCYLLRTIADISWLFCIRAVLKRRSIYA